MTKGSDVRRYQYVLSTLTDKVNHHAEDTNGWCYACRHCGYFKIKRKLKVCRIRKGRLKVK